MRRFGRLREVERMKEEIPLTTYFFDLLYQDGEPLFDNPYQERFGLLSEGLPSAYLVPRIIAADERAVQNF